MLPLKGCKIMRQMIKSLIADESGATAIEYGMIAALIAVAIIASLQLVGNNLTNKFNAIAGNLN
jgi:pilus assembly protein Flp/PilA